jgi:hypothetical protein
MDWTVQIIDDFVDFADNDVFDSATATISSDADWRSEARADICRQPQTHMSGLVLNCHSRPFTMRRVERQDPTLQNKETKMRRTRSEGGQGQ